MGYAKLFARYVPLVISELVDLLNVLQTNLFTITAYSIGIYEAACLLEHACAPNARVTVANESAVLTVRATERIAAGQKISFSYIDEGWLAVATVEQRRDRLRSELGFYCQCESCCTTARRCG